MEGEKEKDIHTCTYPQRSIATEDLGIGLFSWPKDSISRILSLQSEFNLRAKSSTSLR